MLIPSLSSMDFESKYEITRTAEFIRSRNFSRVTLQFPDELMKDSTRVARALRSELGRGVRLFVMADTAFGSCCIDEVGASHVHADFVVHYGHACMSQTSTLPAMFVFGKAAIDSEACAESLRHCLATTDKPILVLYGLEYTHALESLKAVMAESLQLVGPDSAVDFAEVTCLNINPSRDCKAENEQVESHDGVITNSKFFNHGESKMAVGADCHKKTEAGIKYTLGGLTWKLPLHYKMENYLLFWIGSDNSAFSNVVLTFNSCEIVRYDAVESQLLKDFSQQTRVLKRRYYLVEKAKDANIVGILVGTLSVAGYLRIIHQMKELIEEAGKKSYTLLMGRPNSAKLANFPECDVFVYVSCAQTALMDSKEFLSPVITPYEAVLAFSRGRQWTGEYVMEFQDLIIPTASEVVSSTGEARFSFIQGGYMEDIQPQENGGGREEISIALAEMAAKTLNVRNQSADSLLFKGTARSGAEFLAARSYQGLNMQYENPLPQSYIIGRTGRASGYEDEKSNQEKP